MHLIDIGCGLGGASRYFASERGCRVTGIDLTEDYVRAATMLSHRLGLDDLVSYRQASALSLPFADATFDGAYMLHVGMNIADKVALFREVRRVLKPGARFSIYDVMREGDGALIYPLPWAASADTSFVETAASYGHALAATGFESVKTQSRGDIAIAFYRRARERAAQGGPAPLGRQIVMGADARQKSANLSGLIERGVVAPTEVIADAA